jgi:hypothetical protein
MILVLGLEAGRVDFALTSGRCLRFWFCVPHPTIELLSRRGFRGESDRMRAIHPAAGGEVRCVEFDWNGCVEGRCTRRAIDNVRYYAGNLE